MYHSVLHTKGGLIMVTVKYENEKEKEQEKKINLELSVKDFERVRKLLELSEDEETAQKEKEEQEKNRHFVQIYKEHMTELRWLMTKHSFASNLLFFIIEHMDNRNALACSHNLLSEYFDVSRMTIYRAIKILKENGFLDVLKMGNSNVYVINEQLAWTDKNTSKKYSKYDGKILVSHSENKDYDFKSQFDRLKALKDRENL